jgi:peptide deformylase
MARLPIRLYGDPVLRSKARDVNGIDDDLRGLAEDMIETMMDADGAGLAANQVGDLRRIIVVNFGGGDSTEDVRVLVNPEITGREGKMRMAEGCLSIPEIEEEVDRSESVTVDYLNLDGGMEKVEASGLQSAILQHEIDHLDGVLFVDRISQIRRRLLKGALKQIARKAKQMA